MSSIRFGGCVFRIYPEDHQPRHVHGEYGEAEVIVDLMADRTVQLSHRVDRVKPKNAKLRDVRMILKTAAEHFDDLAREWEKMHP